MDGESLDSRIAIGPLESEEAVEIARQIGGALAEAHRKGVVHRDLKPSNVMLEREGVAKVVDFGLAQVAGRSRLTLEGVTVGTAAYLAPEQIQRQKSDERSDIWSLGVVLYEMITGRSPFEGERDEATLYAILHEEPALISQLVANALPALQPVVSKAIEKWPARRYQHVAEFLRDLDAITDDGAAEVSPQAPPAAPEQPKEPGLLRKPISFSSAVVMTLAAAAIAATMAWLVHPGSQPTPPETYQLTQLTRDSGLSYQPSLSSDGKLMAYASDRAAEGNLDIWVQQVPRGNPIRLTTNEADDHDPHFSSDSTTVVFRSERDGGGVYTVPALGGEERILAKLGRRPRFSPDGREVAYWTGESPFVFSLSHIYMVKATGGEPRRYQEDFDWVSHPVWSPDGRRILFSGVKNGVFDWWTAPAQGGAAAPAAGPGLVFPKGQHPIPLDWLSDPPRWLFSAYSGDTFDLWQAPISTRTFRFVGAPERLTTSSEWDLYSSGAADRIAFSSVRENSDIWSFPLDAETHRVTGEPTRLTTSVAGDFLPSLSGDGNRLVFVSSRSGSNDIWLKDLETGAQQALTTSPFGESQPAISPSGSQVVYRAMENGTTALFAIATENGIQRKLCDDCYYPWGWTSGASGLLFGDRLRPSSVLLLDLETGAGATVLQHPEPGRGLWSAALSPDNRWVVFHTDNAPLTRRTFIAPYRPESLAGIEEWIAVTDGSSYDNEQRWAPDGNAIYVLSDRDGFRCVWAQPLDPSSKRPTGEAIEVYHFGRAQLSPLPLRPTDVGLSVARNKFAITLSRTTGNIWMLEPANWPRGL